tara:strand:- start:312 stop:548 length:237 start_codon:yes stop_codon:yes gene_type:complete
MHCLQIENYEDGSLKFRHNFVDGEFEGLQDAYYQNGQLWFKFNLYNGKKHGTLEKYNEDGSVIKIEKYENGKLIKANV